MNDLICGIDVSKASFTTAIWEDPSAKVTQFENKSGGFAGLKSKVESRQQATGAQQVMLVLEPTGGYEQALVDYAHQQGWQVCLPNPRQVREWAKGTGNRAKTDPVDAKMLAHYGAVQRPKAHPAVASEIQELDALLERRVDLEGLLRQERNRLSEQQGRPHMPTSVIDSLKQVIKSLEEALDAIETSIQALLNQHSAHREDAERLDSIPGIGPKNVLPLLVLLNRWHTLTAGKGTDKGLTAYVGLDPQPYQSGSSVFKRASISKMGDAQIRSTLYMAALAALRGKNVLRSFYDRLLGRGKPKLLAIIAAARKLLIYAWTLFLSKSTWDPKLHLIPS